jgi:hypothetical protein
MEIAAFCGIEGQRPFQLKVGGHEKQRFAPRLSN